MKNAAKCDTSCELQNLVSHQNFERNLRFPMGSMSVGVSVHPHCITLLLCQRRLFAFKPLLVRGEYAQMKQQPELAPALQMSRRRDVNDRHSFRRWTISRTR